MMLILRKRSLVIFSAKLRVLFYLLKELLVISPQYQLQKHVHFLPTCYWGRCKYWGHKREKMMRFADRKSQNCSYLPVYIIYTCTITFGGVRFLFFSRTVGMIVMLVFCVRLCVSSKMVVFKIQDVGSLFRSLAEAILYSC